jgi:thiol-disulfide isomerase/thioredoxin
MKIKRLVYLPIFVFAFLVFGYCAQDLPKLVVFHSPSCHRCIQVKQEIIPKIEDEFKDKLVVEYRDIDDIENYKMLIGLEEKYGVKMNNTPPVFYLNGKFLHGDAELKSGLRIFVAGAMGLPLASDNATPVDLVKRFKSFRPLAIVSAGLIDGINPCAFTVIVFFISFLAFQGYRRAQMAIIGMSFIFAVFLTYLLLGLGLFSFIYKVRGFWLVTKTINYLIGAFSLVLGFFAVSDFVKYKKTGDTEGLVLQLPKVVKNRIHAVIGMHYRKGKGEEARKRSVLRLAISAVVTGFLISLLEAVCTGQVYLPTISFVLKTTHLKAEAFGYLLLYNLMFALPLFIIFIFAVFGVTSQQFSNVLKKNMLAVKLLMAGLFFILGGFLIWRG